MDDDPRQVDDGTQEVGLLRNRGGGEPNLRFQMRQRMLSVGDDYWIEDDLKVHGNIVDHEYEIDRDGDRVAEESKKWFRVRDTYGVEIDLAVDPVLIIATTVAVDAMTQGVDH